MRTGNLLYLAGTGSVDEQGQRICGKVGGDLNLEQGYEAARRCAVGLLSTLKNQPRRPGQGDPGGQGAGAW